MKTTVLLLAGFMLTCAVSARAQTQADRIDQGMARLLHGDKAAVDATLATGISNAELRRDVAAVLDFFRAKDARLAQKAVEKNAAAKPETVSFSSLSAHVSASNLRGLRLYIHSALMETAKKYGLDACPFGKR